MFENFRIAPDRALAEARYRALAPGYDASCRYVSDTRRNAIEMLALRAGDTVLDVACGTGAMLPELARRVGPRGRVIGFELSSEMFAIAQERVRREAIGSVVTLQQASAEEARLDCEVDALLFFYTHDVLQSPRALDRLFRRARPGARVVCAGARFRNWWWAAPLNVWVALRARRYLTTYHGLSRPWRHLEKYCCDFRPLARNFLGTGYLGCGSFASVADEARDLLRSPEAGLLRRQIG